MREVVTRYLSKTLSRRGFVKALVKTGITAAAAESVVTSVTSSVAVAQTAAQTAPAAGAAGAAAPAAAAVAGSAATTTSAASVKTFQGPGGAAFAEQLIASGVKYVFGNSASEDAQFYDALVDRPQLKYIITPHEGPGAAMAAGYVKASGEPETLPSEPLAVRNGVLTVDPERNGPFRVTGNLEICTGTGRTVDRVTSARLCRCGHSATKPFCDNTHLRIGFEADGN